GGKHLRGVIEDPPPEQGPTQLLLGPGQQLGHSRRGLLTRAWTAMPVHPAPPISIGLVLSPSSQGPATVAGMLTAPDRTGAGGRNPDVVHPMRGRRTKTRPEPTRTRPQGAHKRKLCPGIAAVAPAP